VNRRWQKPIPVPPQASLFDGARTQLSAIADPITSKLAAREHIASGRNAHQRRLVLDYVRRFPHHTSRELAKFAVDDGIDRFVFARRLPDLEKAALVVKDSARVCAVGGKLSVTWMATQ